GAHWFCVEPRLDRRHDEPVVLKTGASGFFGSNLASILLTQGADSVVLCGATTSGCIRATAIDLLQYGWPTLVPRECVGDRAQAPHEANLFDIGAKYADVVSVDEALAYLEGVPGRVGAVARPPACPRRAGGTGFSLSGTWCIDGAPGRRPRRRRRRPGGDRGGPEGGRRAGPPDRVDRPAVGLGLLARARPDDAAGRARHAVRLRLGAARGH